MNLYSIEIIFLCHNRYFLPLRKLDSQNRIVLIIRLFLHDPKIHNIDLLMKVYQFPRIQRTDVIKYSTLKFKVGVAISELELERNETLTLNGIVVVLDAQGATMSHVLQATPNYLVRLVQLLHNSVSIHIKSYDFINVPWQLAYIVKFFRSLMSEKLKNRFCIYSDDKVLGEKFSKDILPLEYGSYDGSVDDIRGEKGCFKSK